MILKHIGPTDKYVKLPPPPLHINHVKQYTKFNGGGGGHVSLVVKISLHTPFCGCCGKCSIKKKIVKRWILERFVVYFNIILPHKCSLLTYE